MSETEDMTGEAPPAEGAEEPFDAPVRGAPEAVVDDPDALIVNTEGFEGPLDVLLALARKQKVDLLKISVLELVDQYLDFIAEARARRLELAADYLVAASWLAYLKSKLLLPQPKLDEDAEPTGEEMAAILAFQLRRLEAMREAAEALDALPREGVDTFARGAPEGVRVVSAPKWTTNVYDLTKAYAEQRIRGVDATIKIEKPKIFQIEDARARFERMLGLSPDWAQLDLFADLDVADAPQSSVRASSFVAALEFAKAGRIELRQEGSFAPIYIRARRDASGEPAGTAH
ncbi:MAG: ScpA family protein [Pseudomonadota bacterium]